MLSVIVYSTVVLKQFPSQRVPSDLQILLSNLNLCENGVQTGKSTFFLSQILMEIFKKIIFLLEKMVQVSIQ